MNERSLKEKILYIAVFALVPIILIGGGIFIFITVTKNPDDTKSTQVLEEVNTADDVESVGLLVENTDTEVAADKMAGDTEVVVMETATPEPTPMPTPEPTPEPEGCQHEWEYTIVDDSHHNRVCLLCGEEATNEECDISRHDYPNGGKNCACGNADFEKIEITIVGDVMLADYKNTNYTGFNDTVKREGYDYFLKKVGKYFTKDDYTIVSFESVLTDRALELSEKDEGEEFWYWSTAKNAEIFKGYSIELAACANEHIKDLGDSGYQDTLKVLQSVGTKHNFKQTTTYKKLKHKVAVITCELDKAGAEDLVKGSVKSASESNDFVIVYIHGGTEFTHTPDDYKVTAAHNLIDWGADLVVGSHTHCLQPLEMYKGKRIVYSLGNFLYGGERTMENRTVIIKQYIYLNKETKAKTGEYFEMIPCYCYSGDVNNFQPCEIESEGERQAVLDFMAGNRKEPFINNPRGVEESVPKLDEEGNVIYDVEYGEFSEEGAYKALHGE